jgi:hypothetical protein
MTTNAFVVRVDSPELSSEIVEEKLSRWSLATLYQLPDWASVKVCYVGFSPPFYDDHHSFSFLE